MNPLWRTPLLLLDKLLSLVSRRFLVTKVSRKRVSQEFFVKLAEKHEEEGVKFWSPRLGNASEAKTVIRSDTRVVIVCASDYTFDDLSVFEHFPGVIWFVQNLNVESTPLVRPIPIGVEGLQWGRAGLPWHFSGLVRRRKKKPLCLVGPYRATHEERRALDSANFSNQIKRIDKTVASFVYSFVASGYEFVACPRGNGIDTHRFWETLYRGSVPVVKRSAWSENMQRLGVRLLSVDSWGQLSETIAAQSMRPSEGGTGMRREILSQTYWEDCVVDALSNSVKK